MERKTGFLIIGQHKSGKSTQAELLASKADVPLYSSGDFFRSRPKTHWIYERSPDTEKKGTYFTDEDAIRLMNEGLSEIDEDVVIIEGVPRTMKQLVLFEDYVTIMGAVHLDVSDAVAMSRGRSDRAYDGDTSAQQRRFARFHEHTVPVIESLRGRGLLARVDGERSIELIKADISEVYNHHLARFLRES